jgi:surface polysaccharide O-acyltransferase-like enzyme
MFVFFDWVGYFLLGIFLLNAKVRKSTVYTAAILGILGAVLGDWAIAAISGPQHIGYFHGYMSFNIIIGSAAFFFLLLSIRPTKVTSHSKINRIVHWISQNTLPIYLIHIIVLETFMLGLLGDIVLNRLTWNLLIDIPVFTMIVFGISAALVYLLKKIPYLAKLIG